MASNRSNYPRNGTEEEVIETFSQWQWALLFVAAFSPGLLRIWSPAFHSNIGLFVGLQRIDYIVLAIAILVLPFAFAGGSLARAMWERIREPAPNVQVAISVSGAILIAIPSIYLVATGNQLIRPWPGTVGRFYFNAFFYHGVFVLSVLIRHILPLLILSIPSAKERLSTLGVFFGFQMAIDLTGTCIWNLSNRFGGTELGLGSSQIVWVLTTLVNELCFYITLWLLDRLCFPSLRPLVLKFIATQILFSAIGLRIPGIWLNLGLHVISLVIVIVYAITTNPDSLRWQRDNEQGALQT